MIQTAVEGVQDVVAGVLDAEKSDVQLSRRVDDFPNWDSLAFINIIVELSERFSVEVDPVAIVECQSIDEMCEYVSSLLPDELPAAIDDGTP